MEYYAAIKKNELMPFAATWMELEFIILSEVSQTEKYKHPMISLISNLKKRDPNELLYKTETYPQTKKTNLCLPKAKGGDKLGVWD